MALDVAESVGHKIGPLPVYAYIGIGVAGIYGFTKFRSRGAATSTASNTDPSADTSLASSGQYGSADGSAGNAGNTSVVSSGTNPSDAANTATSNEEWSRIVQDWLISHGRAPIDVTNAINNYLAGKPLTTVQRAIVNIAIQSFGVPPTGAPAIVAIPVPTPPGRKPDPGKGGTRTPAPKTSPGKGKHWVWRDYDHKWHALPLGTN